jgi:hypothetical protein
MSREDLGALLGSRPLRTDNDDVFVPGNFVQTINERPQRNVVYLRNLPFGNFVRLSHVQEKEI